MNFKLPGSWRTTAIGIITALAGFITFDPQIPFPQWVESLAKFIMIGGFAAFGIVAKDSNVTGGTVANVNNNPTVVADTAKKG